MVFRLERFVLSLFFLFFECHFLSLIYCYILLYYFRVHGNGNGTGHAPSLKELRSHHQIEIVDMKEEK